MRSRLVGCAAGRAAADGANASMPATASATNTRQDPSMAFLRLERLAGRVQPPLLGHYLDLRLVGGETAFDGEHLAERLDRDLDLVEGRLTGRQPLEPEAGGEQRHQDAVVGVLA